MALTKSDVKKIEEIVDEKLEEKLEEKLGALKSELFDKIDPFLKEIQDNREDREIVTHRLGDHEERIGKLEEAVGVSG